MALHFASLALVRLILARTSYFLVGTSRTAVKNNHETKNSSKFIIVSSWPSCKSNNFKARAFRNLKINRFQSFQ